MDCSEVSRISMTSFPEVLLKRWQKPLFDRQRDTPSDYFSASLQANLSVISDSGQLPASPGFLTHSGCGCNTVSCTVIDCRVLRCQAAELHVGCAGGFVCSQCGLALELLIVLSITISRINPSNPLQALSRPLLHPVHKIVSESITWCLAGKLHWGSGSPQFRPWLIQLYLGVDTCEEKERVDYQRNCHLSPCLLLRFGIRNPLPVITDTRKIMIQLHPMVWALCAQWLWRRHWSFVVVRCGHSCIYHNGLR